MYSDDLLVDITNGCNWKLKMTLDFRNDNNDSIVSDDMLLLFCPTKVIDNTMKKNIFITTAVKTIGFKIIKMSMI